MQSRTVSVLAGAEMFEGLVISPAQLRMKLATMASLARAQWIAVAKRRLVSTEQDYVNAIQPEIVGETSAIIQLVGDDNDLANDIEWGRPPYDMRITHLKAGGKSKVSQKTGFRSLSVPFRHTLSGTGRVGPVVGSVYGGASGLRKAITEAARKLSMSTGTRGDMKWGGRLPASNAGPVLKPTRPGHAGHGSSIYQGMVKIGKPGGRHNQYMTFRMISNNPESIPGSWMHPGIKAHHFMDEVQDFMLRVGFPTVMAEDLPNPSVTQAEVTRDRPDRERD